MRTAAVAPKLAAKRSKPFKTYVSRDPQLAPKLPVTWRPNYTPDTALGELKGKQRQLASAARGACPRPHRPAGPSRVPANDGRRTDSRLPATSPAPNPPGAFPTPARSRCVRFYTSQDVHPRAGQGHRFEKSAPGQGTSLRLPQQEIHDHDHLPHRSETTPGRRCG